MLALDDIVGRLSRSALVQLKRMLDLPVREYHSDRRELKEERFAQEFAVDLNASRAYQAATGNSSRPNFYGHRMLQRPEVAALVQEKMAEREAESVLKAEYVRQYIVDVLEVCPTDHFCLDPDGDWVIDPAKFRDLPHAVKRLVDTVEQKVTRNGVFYSVKFVSKQHALSIAAKFTLTQKVAVAQTNVPWDEIAGTDEVDDSIARRLAEVEGAVTGAKGPVQTSENALAVDDAVRQAEGDHPFSMGEQDNGCARGPHAR